MNSPPQTWVNGELRGSYSIEISPGSESLEFGRGLFETMALRNGRLLCWEIHMDRLERGAEVAEFDLPSRDRLASAIRELPGLEPGEERRMKLLFILGGRSSTPDLIVKTSPYPEPGTEPVGLYVSDAERSLPPGGRRCKVTAYFEEWLVQKEARRRGLFDGLFTYQGRWLSEGSRSNLFFMKSGEVFTPGEESGLLPGVGREAVMRGGADSGFRIGTGLYDIESLRSADDVAAVNSLRGAVSVGTVVDAYGGPVWSRQRDRPAELAPLLAGFYERIAFDTSLDLFSAGF